MNTRTIVFLSFLITTRLIAQTGPKLDHHSVVDSLALTRDTIFIPVPVDTMRFAVIAHEYLPERSFWQRDEVILGSILGSLLAGIVAVFSVYKTNDLNRKREERKEEGLYSAVLASIYSVLLSHDERTKRLKEELSVISDKSIPQNHLIVEKAQVSMSLDLLNQFLIKLLDYPKFNHLLLNTIIAYIHVVTNLNESLDFSPVIKLKQKFFSETEYMGAVQEYFEGINRKIGTLEDHRNRIKGMLQEELKKFPQPNFRPAG